MNKKMFLVAISGETIDGRDLPAADILAIASNYNTEVWRSAIYSDRFPADFDLPHPVCGCVESLEAKVVDGKSYLYAEVAVSQELLERSKHWTADHYFAIAIQYGEGMGVKTSPYFFGLTVTTGPIILGTDVITSNDLAECLP